MCEALPDDLELDQNDLPARATGAAPTTCPPPPRGVSRDLAEEMGRADDPDDDDGPELPDVGPDGFWPGADEWDRYSAAMSLWVNGHGPRPE